jgi:hypothetical protein
MIGKVICDHYNLPENEENLLLKGRVRVHPDVPSITIIHDDRPMLKAPGELEQSKQKFTGKKVIFLARDPRDVIVSSYFEAKNRSELFGDNPYELRSQKFSGSLSEFIHKPHGGFETILEYYNIWAKNSHIPEAFLLVRYEDIKQNPAGELRRVLRFLGLDNITDQEVQAAVDFASFDNMRALEIEGQLSQDILKPGVEGNVNSYKTRSGKIGGFQESLSQDEIDSLNHIMQASLSDFYGYPTEVS